MLQITSSRRAASVRAVASGAHRRFISTEYLHTTKIPTYHFQDSLPRLPIPALEKTAARYIKSATPLLSMHELASTQKAMDEFVAGAGARLQKEIVERDKTRYSSFITDAWFDMYLCNRDPLPLNINPQLTFHDDPIPEKNDQATRAAVLSPERLANEVKVSSSLRGKTSLIVITRPKWRLKAARVSGCSATSLAR